MPVFSPASVISRSTPGRGPVRRAAPGGPGRQALGQTPAERLLQSCDGPGERGPGHGQPVGRGMDLPGPGDREKPNRVFASVEQVDAPRVTCQGGKEALGPWIEQTGGARFRLKVVNGLPRSAGRPDGLPAAPVTRWHIGNDASIELEASRHTGDAEEASNEVMFRAALRF